MNGIDVINNAIRIINKRGLSIGAGANSKGEVCTAVALVQGAKRHETGKFVESAYVEARSILCLHLGIASSYQAIADWNDAFRTTKDHKKIFFRTKEEVVEVLTQARTKALDVVK